MPTYQLFAARDGETIRETFEAVDQDAAEIEGRKRAAAAFHLGGLLAEAIREADPSCFEAALDAFSVEEEPLAHPLPLATMQLYRQLADGLSDMIEEERLREGDIPDDHGWLVELLAKIAAADPGDQTPIAAIRGMHEPTA